ncbi:MAG: hypothetical protein A2Y33_16150 [Spirochaetes bacterium GWF1_51_8]|nr:MAG: hypothetical protein A2Y33_16150 [Spirochaetes bacterium GWF1_51_8]
MIKDLLLNRFTLIMGGLGIMITLIFGIAAGVEFGSIIIRMLIGGILMGGVAMGILFLLPKFIGDENLKVLFPNWNSGDGGGSGESAEEGESQPRVDITDGGDMTVDDLYADGVESRGESYSSAGHPDDMDSTPVSKTNFKESNFENELPRVYQKEESAGGQTVADDTDDSSGSSGGDYASEEFGKLQERAKAPPSQIQNDQADYRGGDQKSSVFNVGKTKITADPAIIAKAIKTVMNRD